MQNSCWGGSLCSWAMFHKYSTLVYWKVFSRLALLLCLCWSIKHQFNWTMLARPKCCCCKFFLVWINGVGALEMFHRLYWTDLLGFSFTWFPCSKFAPESESSRMAISTSHMRKKRNCQGNRDCPRPGLSDCPRLSRLVSWSPRLLSL